MKLRLLHTTLALGLLVGCGGSASHHPPDAQPQGGEGGAAVGPSGTGGDRVTGGTTAAPNGGNGTGTGGNGTSTGGVLGDGGSEDLGGMAGAGAAPAISLPPGCTPRTPKETAEICSLAVDCDKAPSVRTNCYRLASGLWECQCANQERIFRVDNVAGLHACALSAQLCADDSPVVGDETCEPANDASDADSCSIDLACGKPIDLGATTDAQAWLMRFGSAHCNGDSSTRSFNCSCLNGTLTSNYGLLADSGDLACGPLADFCLSNVTPTFSGKETCVPGYFSSDSQGCQRFAYCGATFPLTDGVSLASFKERFATCVPGSGGGSECSCSESDTAFSFRLSTAPNDASCESSIPNCDRNAAIHVTGTPTCEPLYPDTSVGDTCGATLSCVQDATIDNRSIVAEGLLGLTCARAAAGMPWWCSCASGADNARFQLGSAGSTAAQACSQATAGCLEHLSVHFGPSGDLVPPPDPLP